MTKSWWFRVSACLAVVAFFACGQQAAAQAVLQSKPRVHVRAVPKTQVHTNITEGPPPADLYALEAAFTATARLFPPNSDGSPLWPCFGNSSTPNTDCPSIGKPSVTFPNGGRLVYRLIASPSY
jgi:hypothetical protein